MTKQETLENIIKDSFLGDKIDTPELSDFSNEDDLRDYLQERIGEHEVIYYNTAMEYLHESDPSLRESLEIANDMGYEPKNLNSEILATMHIQNAMSEALGDLDFAELFEDSDE